VPESDRQLDVFVQAPGVSHEPLLVQSSGPTGRPWGGVIARRPGVEGEGVALLADDRVAGKGGGGRGGVDGDQLGVDVADAGPIVHQVTSARWVS